MILPMNYEERIDIVDRSTEQQLFSFEEIQSWKSRNMLEYGDLFIVDEEGKYGTAIVFLDNKFFKVKDDYFLEEISEDGLLRYKFYNRNAYGSPFKNFIKRHGLKYFDNLSKKDKSMVYIDAYNTYHINKILDELNNTLSSLSSNYKK